MKVTDQVCGLECIKPGCNVHDFVGPVRIILVDPPADQYSRRKAGAALTAVSIMMIGANTFAIMLFTMGFLLKKFINFHIILCTVGFQFCMPLAILMLNPLYGAAVPLKKPTRKFEHLFLNLIGFGCYVSGGLIAIIVGEESPKDPPVPYTSVHFFSGCVALGLAGTALLIGPCLFLVKARFLAHIHRTFGMLGFIASSVCFVSGILKPTVLAWIYILGFKAPVYLLVFFTTFYTLAVISTPFGNYCVKQEKCEPVIYLLSFILTY